MMTRRTQVLVAVGALGVAAFLFTRKKAPTPEDDEFIAAEPFHGTHQGWHFTIRQLKTPMAGIRWGGWASENLDLSGIPTGQLPPQDFVGSALTLDEAVEVARKGIDRKRRRVPKQFEDLLPS